MSKLGKSLLRGAGFALVSILISQAVGWYLRLSFRESLRKEVQSSVGSGKDWTPLKLEDTQPSPGFLGYQRHPKPVLQLDAVAAKQAGSLMVCYAAYEILMNNSDDSAVKATATKRVDGFKSIVIMHLLAAGIPEADTSTFDDVRKMAYTQFQANPAARPAIYAVCEAWTNRFAGVSSYGQTEFVNAEKRHDTLLLRRLIREYLPEPATEEIASAKRELDQGNFDGVTERAYSSWAARAYAVP